MYGFKSITLNSLKSIWNTSNWFSASSFSTFTQPLCLKLTPALMAEPMKKKKKADPAAVRIREDRKRRKLWRDCRRLMRQQKQIKPLDELNIPYVLIDEKEVRLRKKPMLTNETLEHRATLLRQWCDYRSKRSGVDFDMIDRIYQAREKALYQLRLASPRLYEEAIKINENLFPITLKGPTLTPPIKDYDSPDGEYIDVTRKWDAPKISEVELRKRQKENQKEKGLKNSS